MAENASSVDTTDVRAVPMRARAAKVREKAKAVATP